MMLLEITPLVLIFWVAVRLELVGRRLNEVEKRLNIKPTNEEKDEVIKEIVSQFIQEEKAKKAENTLIG